MGDLMKDDAKFSDLINTYKNFLTPAMKIKVDDFDISKLEIGITDLSVTLDLYDASSANFTIVNVYDVKGTCFIGKVKKKFCLGAIVKVELGYGSALIQVFQGYISNVSMSFGDMPSIEVTALDARGLMMMNNTWGGQLTETKYSEVVKKVMGAYKKLCPKVAFDDKPDNSNDENIAQGCCDLDFIRDVIGEKAHKEFFVLNDTAYFREPGTVKKPITVLERGQGLLSFTGSSTYCNEIIRLNGYSEKQKQQIEVKKPVKTDSKIRSLISPLPVKALPNSDVEDKNEAVKVVDFEADKRKKDSKSGKGTCIGLPELIPSRYLKINRVDPNWNKTYYLKQVTHNFGEDGYTTDFEIGGWL